MLAGDVVGTAFLDANADGVRDAGDAGRTSVVVRLMNAGGDGAIGGGDDSQTLSMTTAASGDFTFAGVADGTYYLAATPPRGLGFSPQDNGDDATDSDLDPLTGRSATFVLADGATVDLDAGLFSRAAPTHVFDQVAEAADYELIYSLDVTNTAAYNANGVPYSLDRGASYLRDFDRVAYYLELVPVHGGPLQYAYVSFDATTSDAKLIGVPNTAVAAQQVIVTNMNVASNVPGVVNGTGITTGNLEFWNSNYDRVNVNAIPNASAAIFDFGDQRTTGGYGSMQIHNHGESQTVLAYNRWGTQTGELGIGSHPGSTAPEIGTDWTFSDNAASYAIKTLQVLVRPVGGEGGEISGRIFNDEGEDGQQLPADTDRPGVTVRLMSPGADGQIGGTDDSLVTQVVTDANGRYRFEAAPAGNYYVAADRPRGLLWTAQDFGGDDTIDSDLGIAGSSEVFALADSQVLSNLDGGLIELKTGLLDNVPEAAGYERIYLLDIFNTASYNANGVPYSVDNSNTFAGTFDRVAYYMELVPNDGGPTQFAYVSMDAFTRDAGSLGVPNTVEALQQRLVSNMNVLSNVTGVFNGDGIETGNIEFWNASYSDDNTSGVPGASSDVYDFGDTPTTPGYGSMQIHNYGASQTIMAYNYWGANVGEIGIGNNPGTVAPDINPDWTFSRTIANFHVKTIEVLVRPGDAVGIEVIVPEAADYEIIYQLDVGTTASYNTNGVPYSIDNSAAFTGDFDRVAYYLELEPVGGGPLRYAYASMSAFTDDVSLIGVPTTTSGAVFQQGVQNMNVYSNVNGIVKGQRITTGNIEFWGTNYSPVNATGVANASDSAHDFGDTNTGTDGYGSMQIHNHGASQTILAFNSWGNRDTADLGIGNNPTTANNNQPDWTFAQNVNSYSVRRMTVMVRPAEPLRLFDDVPEAADYMVVYALTDLPATLTNFNANGVPYSIDNSAQVGNFDRVAYYLELQTPGGERQFAYASMDAFTTDARLLGIPTSASGAFFQQNVTNLNVVSNVAGIVVGEGLSGGNIELWPSNYSPANSAGVPGASETVWDFGDQPTGGAGATGYGSFQIHNAGASQTILAYNAWGSATRVGDLGIGNNPAGGTAAIGSDWTMAENVGDYEIRNIYVLARKQPGLSIIEPAGRIILQRDEENRASVDVSGIFDIAATHVEARAIPIEGFGGTATDWALLDDSIVDNEFLGSIVLEAGWYTIEVRGFDGATELNTDLVSKIGVGDIYVTAGQSNSANSGATRTTPDDERVSAFTTTGTWQFAADPQPIASASGGSPWPSLGDLLAAHDDIPIGFYNVGVGGTSVNRWQPNADDLYPRIRTAVTTLGVDGFRAILWHQGESDIGMNPASNYTGLLQNVIEQSRIDAGFDVPWGVARVSFSPAVGLIPGITAAQDQVIADDLLAFPGPNTDTLIGAPWRDGASNQGIHFSEAGLIEHGRLWSESIIAYFDLLNVRHVEISSGSVDFRLSRPFDPTELNIYDGIDPEVDLPDIQLFGANTGLIAGSFIWHTDRRGGTFIATGGPLPPDDYTLLLSGAADAWADELGVPLDGNADGTTGDNFVYLFTVESGAIPVVELPDFVRGPEQAVDLAGTGGIPLHIDNADGVTDFAFELHYDPALLNISQIVLGADAGGFTLTANDTSEPGIARIAATGPALAAGIAQLIVLPAIVPTDAPHGEAQILRVVNLQLNSGAILGRGGQAVHLAAFLGDASGDKTYSGLDASMIARTAVGLDSGFDRFDRFDPALIGDVTGNGTISALDASFVARKAVGLDQDEIPDLPEVPPEFGPPSPAPPIPNTGGLLARAITFGLAQPTSATERPASGEPNSPSLSGSPSATLVESLDLHFQEFNRINDLAIEDLISDHRNEDTSTLESEADAWFAELGALL